MSLIAGRRSRGDGYRSVIQTIMFTGSVGIGKRIMELASRNLTNVVLELGGKDPMLVCKDADLERAAQGASGWRS